MNEIRTEADWESCPKPALMLAFLSHGTERICLRKMHLFACACCRRIWPLLQHDSARRAVEIAEQFADGLATREELATARKLADAEARSIASMAPIPWTPLTRTVTTATEATAKCALRNGIEAGNRGHDAAARAAAHAAPQVARKEGNAHYTAWSAAIDAEHREQAPLLRDIIGNPFRTVAVDPFWLAANNRLVLRLARTTYDERSLPSGALDVTRLGVLADALEDAGCTNGDILNHCRSPGPHFRGCWVVDMFIS
jgi:hypothetical protein